MPTVSASPRPDKAAAPQSGVRGERTAAAASPPPRPEKAAGRRGGGRGGPPAAPAPPPAGPPLAQPVGLAVSSTAKALNRAFTDELAQAGGSQHVWLILLALKQQRRRTQQEIA